MACVTITVKERPKPEFYVTNVTTDKEEYYTDEEIVLKGKVCNSGNADGYATVIVTVDGREVKRDSVYVIAGGCQDVAYTVKNLSAGDHKLCIDHR